jgi:LysM repeat protein
MMKSRLPWLSLTVFLALVLAAIFGSISALSDDISTTALFGAAADHPESAHTLLSQAVPVPKAMSAPPQVVSAAPLDDADEAQADPAPAEPPVPAQGGTCIEGFIIDHYDQARGAGWKVTVTAEDGTSRSQTADSNGHFRFTGLAGGTWTVALEVPGGWRPFTPVSFPVTLSGSGSNCARVRFKVEAPACLDVTKLDVNDNIGIPGWQMTAINGSTTLTEVTDWQGKCRFNNLVPGVWTVEEESKSGWIPAPGSSSKQTINLDSPRTPGVCGSLTFVNQQIHHGCIKVCKVDTYGNLLEGWDITIKRDDGTWPSAIKTTDKTGCVTFDTLALGQWTVQETIKPWWRPIGPTEQKVDLTEPSPSCVPVTFKNEALGCVDGYKINHLDQGLLGWTIVARNKDTDEEFTTVTDGTGYFKFILARGTWEISEVLQTGWEAITLPEFEVEVTEPFVCQSVRFKNKTDFACVDAFKKDAQDGSGLPGWKITIRPAYGGSPITGVTDGTGHVRFNGLTPGDYIISEEMQVGWIPVTSQSLQVTLEATGSCKVITFENRQTTGPSLLPDTGATSPSSSSCRATYTVRQGNTLYSIANQYGTTVAAVKQANGLSSNIIFVGQNLCIP